MNENEMEQELRYEIWKAFDWMCPGPDPFLPGDVAERLGGRLGYSDSRLVEALRIRRRDPQAALPPGDLPRIAADLGACWERSGKLLGPALGLAGPEPEAFVSALGRAISPESLLSLLIDRCYPMFLLHTLGVSNYYVGSKYVRLSILKLLETPERVTDPKLHLQELLVTDEPPHRIRCCMHYAIKRGWERSPARFALVLGRECEQCPLSLETIAGCASFILRECEAGEQQNLIGFDPESGTCHGPLWEAGPIYRKKHCKEARGLVE